jgi:hypothetical protein
VATSWLLVVAEAGMAVFPSARRAFARPSWMPWLLMAVALLAITFSYPTYSWLHGQAARVPAPPVAETSSLASQQVAAHTSSDILAAAESAWYFGPVASNSSTAQTGTISEVSSARSDGASAVTTAPETTETVSTEPTTA